MQKREKRSPDTQIVFGDKLGIKGFWEKIGLFFDQKWPILGPKRENFGGQLSTLKTKVAEISGHRGRKTTNVEISKKTKVAKSMGKYSLKVSASYP